MCRRSGEGIVLGWFRPRSTRQERGLAWRAQAVLATRAPFAAADSPRDDPDSLAGEAVFHSERIHEALMELAYGIDSRRPLKATAENALAAMSALVVLRPSWIAYCNVRFGLAPEATDVRSEMCRQLVDGDTVRAWPYFAQATTAVAAATGRVSDLQPALADFCGCDLRSVEGKAA